MFINYPFSRVFGGEMGDFNGWIFRFRDFEENDPKTGFLFREVLNKGC